MLKSRFSGKVIQGLHNGHRFGFPTANIALDPPTEKLEKGVFAVKIGIDESVYHGMLYVGTRPTLHLSEESIEINIFDFDQDLYGKSIDFEIVKKIRDEKSFNSTEALINQIKQDKDEILQFFAQ